MSSTQLSSDVATEASHTTTVPMRLEVVVIPVADVDRSKRFYEELGWRIDADVVAGPDFHLVQMTPPASNASIIFGKGITTDPPGSIGSMLLAVDDIEAAREQLSAHGVEVGEAFHDAGGGLGGGFIADPESLAPGLDPERRSYASYARFSDPDGNGWLLQEITERLPGRVSAIDVAGLAELLHETAEQHGAFEAVAPPHDWWDWYAAYMDARNGGSASAEASAAAARYMAERKHIVA